MLSSTACIPAGMSELALLPPCAVSEVVALADLCISLCLSLARGSISELIFSNTSMEVVQKVYKNIPCLNLGTCYIANLSLNVPKFRHLSASVLQISAPPSV